MKNLKKIFVSELAVFGAGILIFWLGSAAIIAHSLQVIAKMA